MPPRGMEIRQTTAHTHRGRYRTSSERKTSTKQNTSKATATKTKGTRAAAIEPSSVPTIAIITDNDIVTWPGRQGKKP